MFRGGVLARYIRETCGLVCMMSVYARMELSSESSMSADLGNRIPKSIGRSWWVNNTGSFLYRIKRRDARCSTEADLYTVIKDCSFLGSRIRSDRGYAGTE